MTPLMEEGPYHASCVAVNGRGVLICGKSGAGKSALALHLMAWGAALVADDRVLLTRTKQIILAQCPAAISGLIEARGIGILRADMLDKVALELVVDLDAAETERLPLRRHVTVLGCAIPLLRRVDHAHFGASILQILKKGMSDPDA